MISIFFSYAHEDEGFRDQLEIHLSMLKRSGLVSAWHDRRIIAGRPLHSAIDEQIEKADVILLLLSPNFLASDYCYEREAARALERHQSGSAVVIPVVVEPCDWLNSPFARLRATPKDGKPIAKYPNQNDAYLEIVQDIREAARQIGKLDTHQSPSFVGSGVAQSSERSSNLRVRRTFSERDRDSFADETFAYIKSFFENSLEELRARNSGIDVRLVQHTPLSFASSIYKNGEKAATCRVWRSGKSFFGGDIVYSTNEAYESTSFNESMTVADDGYKLGIRGSGWSLAGPQSGLWSKQGAAEALWAIFIRPLQ